MTAYSLLPAITLFPDTHSSIHSLKMHHAVVIEDPFNVTIMRQFSTCCAVPQKSVTDDLSDFS
jgi:hypothetical protein